MGFFSILQAEEAVFWTRTNVTRVWHFLGFLLVLGDFFVF